MQNILVATDFSNNAYNALFYTAQLLKNQPCTIYILNVYDEHTSIKSIDSGTGLFQQLKDESHEGLQNTYHRIRLDVKESPHTFEVISKKGNLASNISKVIDEKNVDLVVMGNTGCSELKAIFLGSNTLRAISGIKQSPILTIPKEIDFKTPKEIAFVTDYRRSYNAGLLHPLITVAKQYGSKIRIMHIDEEKRLTRIQEINQGILLEYLKPFNCTEHWMPLYKSKATAIQDFLEELNIDMLAMLNYEHGFIEALTREPVIKRVAYNHDIPFLIIPEAD